MVIWLTGLSGSGKSSIAECILPMMYEKYGNIFHIDGDTIREIFGDDLGFDILSRVVQIKRIQRIAKFISKANIPILVSALYSNPELLEWNRINLNDYFEVYVNAPLDVVIRRDTKGIYKNALYGSQTDVVGIDIEWIPPKRPDLIVNSSLGTPLSLAGEIYNKIQERY